MALKTFLRPLEPVSCSFKEKRSEFITFLTPLSDADEGAAFLSKVRGEHHGATHHVPAWRLVRGGDFCSDDGEPTGTAGRPALGVLLQRNLSQVMVVVVRYFGGVKLGPRGLIEAYGRAVSEACDRAVCGSSALAFPLELSSSYDESKSFLHFLSELASLKSPSVTYDLCVSARVWIEPERRSECEALLAAHRWQSLLSEPPRWGAEPEVIDLL